MPQLRRRSRVVTVAALAFLIGGCTTNPSGKPAMASQQQQADSVQPTGSRISHTVKKGKPAGVANDMPGVTASAAVIESKQNSNAQSDKSNAGSN